MTSPSFNPYAALGVPKDASTADVRRAYRKRSKSVHPDVGGSSAAFQAVNRALLVLSDPEARAHYDKTGEVKDKAPDNADQVAWGVIAGMLAAILQEDADPMRVDVVAAMARHLDKEITTGQTHLRKHQESLARAKKMQSRFRRKKKAKRGANMLESICGYQQGELKRKIEGVEAKLAPLKRAKTLLTDYEFEPDKVGNMMMVQCGFTTTATGGWR